MGEGSLRSEALGRQQGKPEIYQQPGRHDGAEDEIECHGGSLRNGVDYRFRSEPAASKPLQRAGQPVAGGKESQKCHQEQDVHHWAETPESSDEGKLIPARVKYRCGSRAVL